MVSRKLIGGLGVIGVLAVIAACAVIQGHERLLAGIIIALLAIIAALGLVTLLTQRRTARQVALIMRKGLPRREEVAALSGPEVEKADLLGVVRMMQAQYLGRLDRAQDSLEQAVARLDERTGCGSELGNASREAGVVLSVSRVEEWTASFVEDAIKAGIPVVVEPGDAHVTEWINRRGWSDRVVVERRASCLHEDSVHESASTDS